MKRICQEYYVVRSQVGPKSAAGDSGRGNVCVCVCEGENTGQLI